MQELDCLQVKTGEVITAPVVLAEEPASIVGSSIPAAAQGDHGPSRDGSILPFPRLEVIECERCISIRGGTGANINNHERPDKLFGRNAVGAQALGEMQRRINVGADVFLQMPAIGVPLVLPQPTDLLQDKRVWPWHGETRGERVCQIDNALEANTRRFAALGRGRSDGRCARGYARLPQETPAGGRF